MRQNPTEPGRLTAPAPRVVSVSKRATGAATTVKPTHEEPSQFRVENA